MMRLQIAKPMPVPGKLPAVEALEDSEDSIVVLRIDADPVVADADGPLILTFFSGDRNLRRLLGFVLDRVANQVLEYLGELYLVPVKRRKRVDVYRCVILTDRKVEIHQCALDYGVRDLRRQGAGLCDSVTRE